MVTRVDKFLGGLGTDVTNVANVHATENRIAFGASMNPTANVHVTGNAHITTTLSTGGNITGGGTYTGGGTMTTGGNIVIPNDGDIGSAGATDAIQISSSGIVTFKDDIKIKDGGTIGSASDTDAITIASDGVVTMNQIPVFSAGINVSGGTIAGTLATAAQGNITSLGTLTTLTVDNIIINGTNIGHTSDTDSIAIASDGVVTFSQAPVFPDGSIAVADLDIDGATDIGAAIVDADLFIIDDGANGTNRKATMSRLKTYIGDHTSAAADDITAGDAAVLLTTSSGNITIDAAANNSDIILKGTDGGVDTTFLTLDGSAAGKATFSNEIVSGAVITSGAGLVIADAGNIGSASDTDAIAIASDGVVTMNQIPVFSAGINVSGGSIAGTLSTAAQGNITSLGTLTTLTVDNIIINGTNIGHTSDTDAISIGSDGDVTLTQDLELQHDGATISFGGNDEIVLTHIHNTGLKLTDTGGSPTLQLHDADEAISSDGSKLILTSNGVAFNMPTADGDADQVLTTNGSGTLSFAAAASGGADPSVNLASDIDLGNLTDSTTDPFGQGIAQINDLLDMPFETTLATLDLGAL
jgi:hypothetical protein